MLHVFSVLDTKAGAYNTPFFSRSLGEAERSFDMLRSDTSTVPGKYPAEFVLVQLGQFDDQSGTFETHPPRLVSEGVHVAPATASS